MAVVPLLLCPTAVCSSGYFLIFLIPCVFSRRPISHHQVSDTERIGDERRACPSCFVLFLGKQKIAIVAAVLPSQARGVYRVWAEGVRRRRGSGCSVTSFAISR